MTTLCVGRCRAPWAARPHAQQRRRAALGAGARKIAEGYSWDRIARRLVEIYEELAGGAPAERAAA